MKFAVIYVVFCIFAVFLIRATSGGDPGYRPDYQHLLDLATERIKVDLPVSYHGRVDQMKADAKAALVDCGIQTSSYKEGRRCGSALLAVVRQFNAIRKEYNFGITSPTGASNNVV